MSQLPSSVWFNPSSDSDSDRSALFLQLWLRMRLRLRLWLRLMAGVLLLPTISVVPNIAHQQLVALAT